MRGRFKNTALLDTRQLENHRTKRDFRYLELNVTQIDLVLGVWVVLGLDVCNGLDCLWISNISCCDQWYFNCSLVKENVLVLLAYSFCKCMALLRRYSKIKPGTRPTVARHNIRLMQQQCAWNLLLTYHLGSPELKQKEHILDRLI